MAIGDVLTLIKTETVPFYIAFGSMQHLTQVSAKIMSQFPSQIWADKGVNTKLEIEIINPQHNPLTRFPAGNFGFNSLVGNGATFHTSGNNLIIDREGSVETHTNTMELDYGTSDTFRGLVGITCRTNVTMSFYVCNGVYYVKLDYGNGYNKGTAWQYKFNMYNQYWSPQVRYKEAYTSLNLHCAPNDDKNLYINGASSYLCGAIALEGIYRELSFKFQSTCKLFMDSKSIDEYNATGDESGSIENLYPKEKEPTKDRTTILYMNTVEYKSEFSIRKPSEIVGYRQVKFYVRSTTETGDKIKYINRAVVGFCQNNSSSYRNLHFLKNDAFEVYKIETRYAKSGAWTDATKTFDWSTYFSVYKENSFYNGYYYWSTIDTNMYIFDSLISAQKGIQGLLDGLIDGGFGVSDTVETTLTDNIVDYDCGMSETWILDEESARKLATQFNMELNNNNTNIIGDVIIGLSMYQNPIDVVVDFFDIPIEIDDFYESEYDSFSFGINVNEILPPNNDDNIS